MTNQIIKYNVSRNFYINVAEDSANIVVRILAKQFLAFTSYSNQLQFDESATELSLTSLNTTKRLLQSPSDTANYITDRDIYFNQYALINDEKYVILGEYVINKDNPLIRSNLEPGSHFVLLFSKQTGFSLQLLTEFSYFNKLNTYWTERNIRGFVELINLYIIDPQKNINTWNLSVNALANNDVISNIDWDKTKSYLSIQNDKILNDLDLHYKLSSDDTVMKDNYIEFKFEILDSNNNLLDISYPNYKIEAVDGYAPHTRFNVVHGVGKFKVKALDLDSGDQMRVKVYNRLFTSLSDRTVTVL